MQNKKEVFRSSNTERAKSIRPVISQLASIEMCQRRPTRVKYIQNKKFEKMLTFTHDVDQTLDFTSGNIFFFIFPPFATRQAKNIVRDMILCVCIEKLGHFSLFLVRLIDRAVAVDWGRSVYFGINRLQ